MTTALTSRDTGPAVERDIARDIVRRGAMVTPVVVAVAGAVWGLSGVASAALGCALVLVNFTVAAALQSWAARISYGMVAGVGLFGFAIRLAAISITVMLLADMSWMEPWPLGLTLVVGHLGLLAWETRHISASLAYPGLKPKPAAKMPPHLPATKES